MEHEAIEFSELEQRPGVHDVPVPLTEEEVRKTAEDISNTVTKLDTARTEFAEVKSEWSGHIKKLEKQLSISANVYRERKRPKPTKGLWGFDWKDNDGHDLHENQNEDGRIESKTCMSCFLSEMPLAPDVEACPNAPDEPQFPLGKKWFVDPTTKQFFGPFPIVEDDLQSDLPKIADVVPFELKLVDEVGDDDSEYVTHIDQVTGEEITYQKTGTHLPDLDSPASGNESPEDESWIPGDDEAESAVMETCQGCKLTVPGDTLKRWRRKRLCPECYPSEK